MYVLIGEGYSVAQDKIGGDFVEHDFEEEVALFTFKADAKAFAENMRLKTPKRKSFSSPQVFRVTSRMSPYTSYRVEEYRTLELDINPTR